MLGAVASRNHPGSKRAGEGDGHVLPNAAPTSALTLLMGEEGKQNPNHFIPFISARTPAQGKPVVLTPVVTN